jgi:hypothetical protein
MLQASINSIILGFSATTQASKYAPFATDQIKSEIFNIQPPITVINRFTSLNFIQFINLTLKKATPSNNNLDGFSCQSIRTTTSIQIAYANLGNLNNPQAQIQYISYDWSDTTSVYLRVIIINLCLFYIYTFNFKIIKI